MALLTGLETAVLTAIAEQAALRYPPLRDLLRTASVRSRDNTGHGFYTKLAVETDGAPPSREPRFDGPMAYMADMGPGLTMGFILWCEGGYPDCLEGYQNCDDDGRTVDLKAWNLSDLTFTRLEWI